VKQKIEVPNAFLRHIDGVNGAMIQWFGLAAVDAGEMVLIPLHGGVERFTTWQMTTTHHTPLLEHPQVAVHGGQSHRGLLFKVAVKLLAAHLISGPAQGV